MRVLGIDEAGRGCVLGSLVIGAFLVEDPDDDLLRAAGAADSKALSAKKRVEARAKLAELGTADVFAVPATAIDKANLNALEEAAIASLITRLRPDVVFMDALGPPKGVDRVRARIEAQIPEGVVKAWTIAPKADRDYAVVGAASIFAKTTRDALLEELQEEFGALGSGYPGDPKTKAWLAMWSATGKPWPAFVRTRWQTIQDLGQQGLFGG